MGSRSRSHGRYRHRRDRRSRDRSHSRERRAKHHSRHGHESQSRREPIECDRRSSRNDNRSYENGRREEGWNRKGFRYDSPPKRGNRNKRHHQSDAVQPQVLAGVVGALGMDTLASKPYREIYIGNIPQNAEVSKLLEFINEALIAVNGTSMPGPPCQKGWISADGHYAFVEMRTMEEASNCIQLSGINYYGFSLRINRPKTYNPEVLTEAPSPTIPTLDPSLLALGIAGLKGASEQIAAAADLLATERAKMMTDRLCIENVTNEEAIKKELEAAGTLKYYQYINQPSGFSLCLFEYEHIEMQKSALKELERCNIKIKNAVDVIARGAIPEDFVRSQIKQYPIMQAQVPTRALMLANLVAKEDLEDDEEYYDIIDDVRVECEEYGHVVRLELPRVPKGLTIEEVRHIDCSAVGCAFVLFADIDGASKARKAIDGRKFGHRTVECHFFSELFFHLGEFSNPKPNYQKEHSSLFNPIIAEDPNQAADILNEIRENAEASTET